MKLEGDYDSLILHILAGFLANAARAWETSNLSGPTINQKEGTTTTPTQYKLIHHDGSETSHTRLADARNDLDEGEYIVTMTRLWGWQRVHLGGPPERNGNGKPRRSADR